MKKKDIFNGNIAPSHRAMVKASLIMFSAVMFGLALLFLFIALLYWNVEPDARILLYIFSGVCFLSTVLYPLLTIYFVRRYQTHPKIARVFLKDYVFVQPTDNQNERQDDI